MNKKAIIFQIVFFIFVGISSIYYFYIGQWKVYVAWFAIVEFLMMLITLSLFIMGIIKKKNYTFLKFSYFLICAIQLFPSIGALLIGGRYLYNIIIHLIIIAIGTLCIDRKTTLY